MTERPPGAALFVRLFPLADRNVPVFHRGGEHNLRLGLAEVLQLVDEVIQLLCGLEKDLDQHGIRSGHTVALDDVRDGVDERVEFLFLCGLDLEVDKSLDVVAEQKRVELRMVSADNAGALHLLDQDQNQDIHQQNRDRM